MYAKRNRNRKKKESHGDETNPIKRKRTVVNKNQIKIKMLQRLTQNK